MKSKIALRTVLCGVLGLGAAIAEDFSISKDWKIFCMPAKHLDVGWSYLPAEALDQDYPGSVEEYQIFSLARTLRVRESTARHPPDARYRWFLDAAWVLEQAQKYQPNLIPRLRQLINAGEFGYNPIYANLHTMLLSHEQLMRMMAYARVLEREGFRQSRVASASDAHSVGWGYASALAAAGIKYFIKGTYYWGPSIRPGPEPKAISGRPLEASGLLPIQGFTYPEPAPMFRWTGPDGKKVLFFYHDDYRVMAGGGNWGEALNEATVLDNIRKYEKLSREGKWPYDAFPMYGSEGDWGVPDTGSSNFIRDWSHPRIRLMMSTPEEFFDYIETHFADKVPDGVAGGWGVSHEIEEASFAKPGARKRANDHLLLAAEAYSAVLPIPPDLRPSTEDMRRAWLKQVLYHEHSFGFRSTGPGPESRRQYAWKNRLTEQVEETARFALDPMLAALADQIPSGGERSLAVLNSLSFPHTDVVEVPLEGDLVTGAVRVVEADTDREAPSQIRESEAGRSVRFIARAVPAVGYRSFRLERATPRAATAAVMADAGARTLENQFYRLRLAPDGSVASLFDKELQTEIFDADSSYQGNQFIFKDDDWQDHSPAAAEITVEYQGSVSTTLKVVSSPMGLFPRSTRRYTLHAGMKRLDIANSFTKEPGKTDSAETVFYAYPFAVPNGEFHVEIPGVVAKYPDEFRPETSWTYMPAYSFVSASNDRISVVLASREAPNFTFLSMEKFFDHGPLPDLDNTTIFAMPLTKQTVNRHDFDFEGGTYEFHYALTTSRGPFRPAEALRFGWGFQRDLLVAPLTNPEGSLPAAKSFLDLDAAQEVLVSTLKQADDGRGLIVRLWNPGNQPVTVKLSLPDGNVTAGLRADLLERDTGGEYQAAAGGVVVPCGAREFVTVRLVSGNAK